jgi:hypothetical protein
MTVFLLGRRRRRRRRPIIISSGIRAWFLALVFLLCALLLAGFWSNQE